VQQTDEQRDNNSSEDSILIPLATAKDIALRGYDAILDLVSELPNNVAAQCNPADPQIAVTVLESECTYIVFAMHPRRTPRGRKSGRISPLRQMQNDSSLCVAPISIEYAVE